MKNSEEKPGFYEFGQFRLDAAQRVLFKGGEPVNLPPKVFDTLLALVLKSGRIVERDELMSEVWKETFVEEANLSVNISALRKTLGKTDDALEFIETVPRRGYRFRAVVSRYSGDLRNSSDSVVPEEDETFVIRRRLQTRIIKTEIEYGVEDKAENQNFLAATNTPVKSLAVLPFLLLKTEPGDEYLSLSLADALIKQLSSMSRILIRPTSAIKKYADSALSSLEAGRELKVDAVLECSVYRIGDKMRVTAVMIKTESENSLWTDKFDVRFKDIFDVQDSIAGHVAHALTLRLNEQERELLTKRYTNSGEAFREYLKGRYFWNKRDVEGFGKAVGHFKKAIDFDPAYALAYTGLADTYNMLPMWGEMSPEKGYLLARAAALRALEIDDRIAEAHASLGYTKYVFDWDWKTVERSYRRALELNPNCVAARSWYAKFFVSFKRFDEAHEQMRYAYEIDPLSPMIAASVVAVYLYERRYQEAIEKYLELLRATPNFVPALIGLGLAYLQTGKPEQAISAHRAAVTHSAENPVVRGLLAGTQAAFGNQEAALQVIEKLKTEECLYSFLNHTIASIYAQLKMKDEAFHWLERAYERRISHLADLLIDPEFDNLRDDSQFDDLLQRIGLINGEV